MNIFFYFILNNLKQFFFLDSEKSFSDGVSTPKSNCIEADSILAAGTVNDHILSRLFFSPLLRMISIFCMRCFADAKYKIYGVCALRCFSILGVLIDIIFFFFSEETDTRRHAREKAIR